MANELQFARETGLTITASVYEADGTLVSGSIACTEASTSGLYIGDMPAASAGVYTVIFSESVNGFAGAGKICWDGSAEITLNMIDSVVDTIDSTTLNIETDVANIDTNVSGLNNLSAADVNAEVDTALADYDAPTRAELTSDISTVTAAISGLNDISAADVRTELSTELGRIDVAVSTRNSVAPDNASIAAILADTDELQSNQGDWATATGFSTHSAADVYTEFTTGSNEDVFKADISTLSTFDPATDTVARVTLVDTTTTNTDMRGTDGAVTSIGTVDANITQVNGVGVTNISEFTDEMTAAEMHSALDSYTNKDDWKANVSGTLDANIVEVNSVPVSGTGTDQDPWGP